MRTGFAGKPAYRYREPFYIGFRPLVRVAGSPFYIAFCAPVFIYAGFMNEIGGKNVYLRPETKTAMKILRGILVALMSALVLHAGIRVASAHHCCAEETSFSEHLGDCMPGGCTCCDARPCESGCCHVSCHGLTFVRPSAPVEVQARQLLPAGAGMALPVSWMPLAPVELRHVCTVVDSPLRLLSGRSRLALFSVLVI